MTNPKAVHFHRLISAALLAAASLFVSACSKTTPELPTAARVKQVEERQRTDPNFFLKEKSIATPASPSANAVADSANPATATKPAAPTPR